MPASSGSSITSDSRPLSLFEGGRRRRPRPKPADTIEWHTTISRLYKAIVDNRRSRSGPGPGRPRPGSPGGSREEEVHEIEKSALHCRVRHPGLHRPRIGRGCCDAGRHLAVIGGPRHQRRRDRLRVRLRRRRADRPLPRRHLDPGRPKRGREPDHARLPAGHPGRRPGRQLHPQPHERGSRPRSRVPEGRRLHRHRTVAGHRLLHGDPALRAGPAHRAVQGRSQPEYVPGRRVVRLEFRRRRDVVRVEPGSYVRQGRVRTR